MFGARHDEGNGHCLHWFHFHYTALTAKPFIFFGVPLSSLCIPYVSLGSVPPTPPVIPVFLNFDEYKLVESRTSESFGHQAPRHPFPLWGTWRRINKPSFHGVNRKKTKTKHFFPSKWDKQKSKKIIYFHHLFFFKMKIYDSTIYQCNL